MSSIFTAEWCVLFSGTLHSALMTVFFSQGRFTLLLGPPSSGKSTLLKSLSGAVMNGEDGLRMRGSITYNGETLDKFQVG